jgi:hypothetical protein
VQLCEASCRQPLRSSYRFTPLMEMGTAAFATLVMLKTPRYPSRRNKRATLLDYGFRLRMRCPHVTMSLVCKVPHRYAPESTWHHTREILLALEQPFRGAVWQLSANKEIDI